MAAYIKERTKNAQFIVISLRNNMFELASRLVGVYKVNHMVSRLELSGRMPAFLTSRTPLTTLRQTKSVTIENKDYIVPRQ